MVLLIGLHLTLIRLQGVTEFEFPQDAGKEKRFFDFFPDHAATELILALVLSILLLTLAIVLPAHMGPRADPLSTPEIIKPEWFFYVAFRWLKLFPGTFAVLSTGFIVFTMFAWPFIDAWLRRKTKRPEISVWIGIFGVIAIIALTLWEALVAH
jgi:ubiquinol-cytochrome c reductase cytochrome b subunit/cytochrome b6